MTLKADEDAGLRERVARLERQMASLVSERVSIAMGALPSGTILRRDAAEFLGLKTATLHRWAHLRIGPPFTVWRNKARYQREELEQWAADNMRKTKGGGRRPAEGKADAPLLAGL
jgi:hypothetical protein